MNRILVVDDEPIVREVAVIMLEDLGYEVVEAVNGEDAYCKILLDGDIVAIFTDIVMPRLDGLGLAAKAWQLRPDLKILFTSGNHCGIPKVVPPPGRTAPSVLMKPYRAVQLGTAITQLLAA